jgi:hypothetical protein
MEKTTTIEDNWVVRRILDQNDMKFNKGKIITKPLFSPWDTFAYSLAQKVADGHGVSVKLYDMAQMNEDHDYAYVFSAMVKSTRAVIPVVNNLLEAQNEFEGGIKNLVDIALSKRPE